MQTKVCSKCGKELDVSMFYKKKNGKYGVDSWCKPCKKIETTKYKSERKELISEQGKVWHQKNREANNARHRLDYKNNKPEHAKRSRIYQQNNKEKCAKYYKKYKSEHKEIIRVQDQRRRTNKRGLPITFSVKQWDECKLAFDNKCAYCGKKNKLTQEHFVPLSKGGEYSRDNIVPACQSCNSSKHAKDFFYWYPTYEHYSKKREIFILKYLKYDKSNIQQLSISI